MQIHEIRQLVQCIGVIVLIHREICPVGILSHLAIMVQMKQFHQAVSHLLPGFHSHDPAGIWQVVLYQVWHLRGVQEERSSREGAGSACGI